LKLFFFVFVLPAAAASASGIPAEIDGAVDLEVVIDDVDVYGLGFFQELRVDNKIEAVKSKALVIFCRLIQSQSESRSASARGLQVDTDRFSRRKIFLPDYGF